MKRSLFKDEPKKARINKHYQELTGKWLEADIKKARTKAGFAPIKITKKKCLRCESEFKSEGSHNRLCSICRDKNLRDS